MSVSFTAIPVEAYLDGSYSGVSAAIGAVSVSPYPCKNFIPISSTHLPTFASIGAAAETIILRFPPKLSNISLKTFLFISIFTFFKRFVICIIEFTIPSFLLFLIVSFIFLYRLSISNGTASIAVGFDSCKFGTIYLSPSHTATEHPHANGSKKPIVDSYVWCNGSTENSLSEVYNLTYSETAFILAAKFLLQIITPLDLEVVPEVNINILNSSGSISISKYDVSPLSNISFPSCIR